MKVKRLSKYRFSRLLSSIDAGCGPTSEDCFARIISLERKRAERSGRLFLLMLLDVGTLVAGSTGEKVLCRILSALSSSVRETDVTGWHKNGSILGIVFTDIAAEARPSIAGTLVARVSGLLYNTLAFEQFNGITICHHLFPEEWHHDVPQRATHPSLYPDLSRRDEQSKVYTFGKRSLDIAGSLIGLLLSLPVFLVIALAIKASSSGPILFRQIRVGQNGRPFLFLKFRSMYVDNDPAIHEQYVRSLIEGRAQRNLTDAGNQSIFKLTCDPRITRVGAFLRKTSFDELPQLLNVLHGEMSLVGPRPAIPYEVQAYNSWHRRRILEAKPGITGLWQVKGRSRVTFDEMVRLDVQYASKRSLWLDLLILLKTPAAVILGSGAC